MKKDSACGRCYAAILSGRRTVREIAVFAHISDADSRTYLTRLRKSGLIEKEPAYYVIKKS